MSIDNATPEQWHAAGRAAMAAAANVQDVKTEPVVSIELLNAELNRPFGEVSMEAKAMAFLLWKMGYSVKWRAPDGEWITVSWLAASWANDTVYRIEPQVKLPEIDWSQVAPEYQWLAVDESGIAALFSRKPVPVGKYWITDGDTKWCRADVFVSYVPGVGHWEMMITKRPETLAR